MSAFSLTPFTGHILRFIHVVCMNVHSFSLLSSILFYKYTTIYPFAC